MIHMSTIIAEQCVDWYITQKQDSDTIGMNTPNTQHLRQLGNG